MDGGFSDFVGAEKARTVVKNDAQKIEVRIARNMEDMMRVATIRAAVYMAEQNCPYEEEFDGNDFTATHMIGYVDGEPAACLRMRYFAGFVKLERVAVRHNFRKSRVAFTIIREAINFAGRKGFTCIYGHARDELIPLWKMFGFRPLDGGQPVVFSDFSYTEMVRESDPAADVIGLGSDPYQLIRPEGDWDRPSVLEKSIERETSRKIRDLSVEAA